MARGKGRYTPKLNQATAGWKRSRENTAARNVVGKFKSQ
jgi:hypothetical protein